jgi:hypothetical protein
VSRRERPVRPDDPDADAPEWWRRSSSLRRVPIIAAIVLGVILIRAGQGTPPPALRKSCTTPAFALSVQSSPSHQALQWTATGPPGMHYQLGIGVSGFVSTQGKLIAEPDPGLTRAQTQAASPQLTMGASCTNSSHFGLVVPPGTYTVRLFRLSGTRALPSAAVVAEQTLTVTDR